MTSFTHARAIAATPPQVFAAFTAPERLARWWGPDGFRNTITVFELRPGGQWRYVMHAPDGVNYPNEASFVAIDPNRSLVIAHTSQPQFQLTLRLEPTPTGTLVTWTQTFESAELAATLKPIVEPANEQNLSRWQAEVASGSGRSPSSSG